MRLVSDPAIAEKIWQMQQRVRWQDPLIVTQNIDQTRLVIEDGQPDSPEFSFLVIGDSGSGPHRGYHPQRQVAELLLPHRQDCSFVLHTGDVIYLVGSSEYYPKNFIAPYREFLVGGDRPRKIAYDRMVFNFPFLPVLGNHDYYDIPSFLGILSAGTLPLRRLLQSKLDLDVGWHGSRRGDAYARAFIDYLQGVPRHQLQTYLEQHYNSKTETGRCLTYEPGHFTRLPNRYYSFRRGGIDFFALDSNTFNAPLPLADTHPGAVNRDQVERQRQALEQERQRILETATALNPKLAAEAEQLDDLHAKVSQIEEAILDTDKQLSTGPAAAVDWEQLNWLKQRLIASWHDSQVRGRVLYFHHPPYVTEATKWNQAQTLAVRYRLRQVLDEVATAVGDQRGERGIVDLVLNGHAHCLEYLQTLDTGHGDADTHWLICGGSGFSLRRQRVEGQDLYESRQPGSVTQQLVAQSRLFVGRNGYGRQIRRPYSCLRIDVQAGCPPRYVIRPLVAEWYDRRWRVGEIPAFTL